MIWLRKLNKNDLDFLVQNFPYYFFKQDKEFIENTLNGWLNENEDKVTFTRCIMLDDEPIGIISMSEKEDKCVGFGIALLERYRGNGYSSVAFDLAKPYLISHGITKIKSSCSAKNLSSKHMHEKLGFKLIKTEINHVGNEMHRFEYDF